MQGFVLRLVQVAGEDCFCLVSVISARALSNRALGVRASADDLPLERLPVFCGDPSLFEPEHLRDSRRDNQSPSVRKTWLPFLRQPDRSANRTNRRRLILMGSRAKH